MIGLDYKVRFSYFYLGLLAFLGFGILFTSFDPNTFDPMLIGNPEPPSLQHWFGTDDMGRDLLLRCIDGARISFLVALISVSISTTLGVVIGAVSGYFGGLIDRILMRFVDIMLAIPSIFLILTVQVILQPSIINVMIVIGVTSWMGVARLVRAEVLGVKERTFVIAAKARGIKTKTLLVKHVLPHTLNPIIVAAMLGMGGAILTESVLSFLGLGVQPPHASWGNMLENSLSFMREAPWMALIPGLLITFTVVSLNFLGDHLRSALDPRGKHA